MRYATTQEHLLAELDRIDAILEAAEDTENPVLRDESPTTDAATLAAEPSGLPLALPERDRERIGELTDEIERNCVATGDATLRLRVLADRFDLSRRHLDALLLALAPRLDTSYTAQYERLQENRLCSRLTVVLLERLFSRTPEERLAAGALVASESPLRRHGLLEVVSPPDGVATERGRQYVVDDRIVDYLKGYDGLDPALETTLGRHAAGDAAALETREIDPTLGVDDLVIDDDLTARLASLPVDGTGRRFYFSGPDGTEKHRALEAVCSAEEYLRADLEAVLDAGALDALVREATLLGKPLQLTGAGAATFDARERERSLEAVLDRFADVEIDLFVTGVAAWTPSAVMDTEIDAILEFPRSSLALRRRFWTAHADDLPEDLDPEVLAGTFELTHGQLEAALSTARSLAGGDEITADDVYEGCRAQSADGLDELAQQLEPDSDWDDIQLRDDTMRKLELVCDHVRHQGRIYGDWGFEEQFSRGTGVVALFKGDSGTGKTMAAEILANDVGMDLYKIDLSSVVSKYIGETEENLERIFEEAEHSNAILLFDEADAVFGDRSQVSSATDRYANVEVNYLLQRVEAYDGVILMTTNYASNIDSAFTRRIDHTVTFEMPHEATRERIWKHVFPADAPTCDIDYEFLSSFEFTGGRIKTIGQTAAILAAGDDDEIGMAHIVRAVQLEYEKTGRLLQPPQFEPYDDHLRLE
ncbi:ATP-binding protein [Natrinema gari]|uniref:AAA family ATPase n=1 Tax=Natrinema gari JCM 14663 TaxID=1230459 RepID=L9Z0L3_9EURY|nr:AAA family ATPase [Natrinema gari]ELY79441.1 AAA family ATPase [Natrinema gari JCM 14663]